MTDDELKKLLDKCRQRARGSSEEDFKEWFDANVPEENLEELYDYRKKLRDEDNLISGEPPRNLGEFDSRART